VVKARRRAPRSGVARHRAARRRRSSLKPSCRIAVLGVGGAGNQIVSRLVRSGVTGAGCIAINTDLKDLNSVEVARKVLIGEKVTCGLSAGGNPETGRAAAQESRALIEGLVEDVDVAFVVVGLGGGTGTGAAPIVAETARRKGAVVVGVVTTPFRSEEYRSGFLTNALNQMRMSCDTVVIVDNDKILKSAPRLSLSETCKIADQIVANTIKGIVETLLEPSMINLDVGSFKTVVRQGGVAIVGVGESISSNRAEEAVRNALDTPLLNVDCAGATGALIHVTGGSNMTVQEVDRVRELVSDRIGRDTRVVWGAQINPDNEGLQVTLVMTGVDSQYLRYGLGNMMSELYDIESSYTEREKSLAVDFGLDQIEDFED
jgi:cell division protein FtsZ